MGRSLTREGACYRHVVEYVDKSKPSDLLYSYHGPYDTPGQAKGQGTRWMGPRFDTRFTLINRYTEISETWRRI